VGVTFLAVDSVFMMPHLGVLSQIEPEVALNVLEKDCFLPLGPVIAPEGDLREGEPAVSVRVSGAGPHGESREILVNGGEIRVLPLAPGTEATAEVEALGDARIGGKSRVQFRCPGGVVGAIVDARGRPFAHAQDPAARAALNAKWGRQMGAYGL
jgi:hypothetical protein